MYVCMYIYIYIYIYKAHLRIHATEYATIWRDAVRGARWGLEYVDLLRDIWASLTSHSQVS